MTIKQLAFDAHLHLHANTGNTFKRSHVYELLAAAFGFNSYASLCAEHLFTQGGLTNRSPAKHGESVERRGLELDYPPETALQLAQTLPPYLTDQGIGVIRIADLVAHLRNESNRVTDFELDESDGDADDEDAAYGPWFDREFLANSVLLDGLKAAAEKDDANAHYALALIYDPSDAPYDEPRLGSNYWYNEERKGRVLTGVEKEWADEYAARLSRSEKYEHHLRAAGALGHEAALLEMAERFGEIAFFERLTDFSAKIDAAHAADVAEHLGRRKDALHWRTIAAKQGDIEAMRELIEGDDQLSLQQRWTWFYLATLCGANLAQDEYRAINEDGSDYDDDVGGPAYVGGRGGVELEQIDAEQDAVARQAAATLYRSIETSHGTQPNLG